MTNRTRINGANESRDHQQTCGFPDDYPFPGRLAKFFDPWRLEHMCQAATPEPVSFLHTLIFKITE